MNSPKHQFPSLGTVLAIGCFWSSLATAWFSFLFRNSTTTSLERFIALFPVFFLISCVVYIARKGCHAWFQASILSAILSLFPASFASGAFHGRTVAGFIFLLWFFCVFVILQWFFLQKEIEEFLSEFETK
jgi:hypothetical protein